MLSAVVVLINRIRRKRDKRSGSKTRIPTKGIYLDPFGWGTFIIACYVTKLV
jgi:hypothetical protein